MPSFHSSAASEEIESGNEDEPRTEAEERSSFKESTLDYLRTADTGDGVDVDELLFFLNTGQHYSHMQISLDEAKRSLLLMQDEGLVMYPEGGKVYLAQEPGE